jgi:hypothetical protein
MKKQIDIAIFGHATPEVELQDYELTKEGIEEYARDLSERLHQTAHTISVLLDDGWSFAARGYNIEATHPAVLDAESALERVTRLGVQDEIHDIGEWDGPVRLNPV